MFFRTLSTLLAVLVLSAGAANASEVGGPSLSPGQNKLNFGAHLGYPVRPIQRKDGATDEIGSVQFLLKAEYGIIPQIGVFLEGGVADARVRHDGFKGILGGAYGGGAKASLFDPGMEKINVSLILEALSFQSQSTNRNAAIVEYQSSIIYEFTQENLTAYTGLKFSWMDLDISNTPGGGTYGPSNVLGGLFGADYHVTPQIFFNAEIQIYDQQALYLSVGYTM